MKYVNSAIIFSLLFVCITSVVLGAAEPQPARLGPADKCPVCGMFVAKYPDFAAQIVFKDGTQAFFDGVKDMMKYYFNLPIYNPSKTQDDIALVLVTDYYSLKLINGFQAFYVMGSDVYGPMGKELIPFQDEAAAKEFQSDHQGKSIVSFQNITRELIGTLD